jgi:hypothetical protein
VVGSSVGKLMRGGVNDLTPLTQDRGPTTVKWYKSPPLVPNDTTEDDQEHSS